VPAGFTPASAPRRSSHEDGSAERGAYRRIDRRRITPGPIASLRRHAPPQVVERNAVLERRAVDHLTVVHPPHPGIAVVVASTVIRDPAAIPDHDHGVAIGVDQADARGRNRSPSANRAPNGARTSSANYCRVAYSRDAADRRWIRHTMSGAKRSVIVPVSLRQASRAARTVLRLASLMTCARVVSGMCGGACAGRARSSVLEPCTVLPMAGPFVVWKSGPTWIAGNRIAAELSLGASVDQTSRSVNQRRPVGCRTHLGRNRNDQSSSSESSIRLPNGSAKKASLRLIAGNTHGSATILTPRSRSSPSVLSTLATPRQKWW
jgi:hypothetical protein